MIVWGFGGGSLILVAKGSCVDYSPGLRFLLASKVRWHLPRPCVSCLGPLSCWGALLLPNSDGAIRWEPSADQRW